MRRRLLVSHLAVAFGLLLLLEVPLGVVYSRHEHDALDATLQRDAAAVAAFIATSPAGPLDSFVRGVAPRGELIVAVAANDIELTEPGLLSHDPGATTILRRARSGPISGEIDDLVYEAVPTSTGGAVLVARGDDTVDDKVHRAWLALAAGGAVLLVGAALVSMQVSRRLARPLARLDRTAAAIGDGALLTRADETAGPPEITALARTLNRMADQLGELLSSQRRFVADASHQLRTPLTALRLRLEGQSDDGAANGDEREATLAELGRLSRIVDGLLALAQAEGVRTERSVVDVAAALRDRCETWSPLAEEHGIAVSVSAPSVLRAWVVEGQIEQILDNLIDNAVAACDAGGSIELGAVRSDGHIEVIVTDSGRGMTNDERLHAFDPFWRGAHDRSGTGLGLAIVEQLVRANGGRVTLEQSATGGVAARVVLDAA